MFKNFVQILVQSLYMTFLATYPKFSSKASLDFELQQICAKLSLNFHSQIYRSNVCSCLVEVVDILSPKPTKMGLHFLIFLWISMIFLRCWTKL
jgi:hypothetical protein